MGAATALERGRDAFIRHAWGEARACLAVADREASLGPADLERISTAAYLAGQGSESVELWSRAHHEWLNCGQIERAVRCAFWLAFGLLSRGEEARAAGWLARASRMLDHAGSDCVERGYLLVPHGLRHVLGGDPDAAYPIFCEADEIARRFADRDLLALVRHSLGRTLIRMGRIDEGVAALDEAMAAVEAGDVSPLAAGDVFCSVIEGCMEIFDLRRAQEWTGAMAHWCDSQPDLVRYSGECLVHRAEILRLQGAWAEASVAAQRAGDRLLLDQSGSAAAVYQQGELYRLTGELAKAEEAYRQASLAGRKPDPGLPLLRLAQGRIGQAAAAIRRALGEASGRARRSSLLPAYVEIMLAAGEVQAAHDATEELERYADELNAPLLTAIAGQARGAVLLTQGDARGALTVARRSENAWNGLTAPYESARVRILIGLACRELGDCDSAEMEFDAARSALQQLGAAADLARLERLSGVRLPRTEGLSPRELTVLRLIASGKTNRAVASELGISQKTVARHVSNIFTKLGVSSRAAATAFAYQRGLV
jgi:DNA-binding CsgD family transcriptional regulator/tetratricopeptide (TPR) repeat protein